MLRSVQLNMVIGMADDKRQFVLPLNNHPEVRQTFAAFIIEARDVTYSTDGGGEARTFGEVIISN